MSQVDTTGQMVRHTENNPSEEVMAKRAKKKVNCNECNEAFSRKADLQQHRREEHSTRRKSVCPVCKKTFESEKRLKMHSQHHNVGGEYECFYCHKQFNKAWKMKIHLVNHSGRPSYICQYCGDDFLYPGKIVSHLKRIHDVWYACKECGEACPVNVESDGHKCKVYGCKDCLMSFASRSELALHVQKHNSDEKHLVTEVPTITSTPPPLDDTKVEDMENDQADSCKTKVVKFVSFGRLGSSVSVKQNNGCDTMEPLELSARELDLESNTARNLLLDQNVPDSPMFKCAGDCKNIGETESVTANECKAQSRESSSTVGTLMLNDGEEVGLSLSFSPVFSKSSSGSSWGAFKVPETSITNWKRYENPIRKSFHKKQGERERAAKKKEELMTRFLSVDKDAKLTQRSQISFESWLTGDSYSSANHDFVFGFEASVTVSDHPKESLHYFNKKIPKKEKADMTFEDLCQF